MDDDRIRALTEEVLAQIREGGAPSRPDLESRVAALEATVSRLVAGAARPGSAPTVHVHTHPSLQVLSVPAGSDRCLMEPDKPCVRSGACRTLGH